MDLHFDRVILRIGTGIERKDICAVQGESLIQPG